MRLTIIAPESVYEHEVDPSMEVRDVKALIEAESGAPVAAQALVTDSGVALTSPEKTLDSYGLKGESATLFLTFSEHRPFPLEAADADYERMRLQILGDPRLMNQLRQANPDLAAAVQAGGSKFRDMARHREQSMRDIAEEKQRQTELLNADPYDIEAQKKIEEVIRMEAVQENMSHAMEYSPESFGRVTMLYINVEVNGRPVKAFVDSGAQSTIISPECAEACGIMRLMDTRFESVAHGVGTAKILGRVHSAQIKLGNLFLPVAFSVLEGQSIDLLFGLDMLKRHQACIDLSTDCLRIGETSIPFLPEHELPEAARNRPVGPDLPTAPPSQPQMPNSSPMTSSAQAGSSRAPGTTQSSVDIQTLVSLGATPDQATQLLEAAGGDVDVAASMMFG